jgi:DMSO/TMAO reductase YedYZ molybdopterin-dependent catalytic subunit
VIKMRRMTIQGFTVYVLALSVAAISSCSAAPSTQTGTTTSGTFTSNPSVPGEVEATEFLGTKLTPIKQQRNNALAGTQHINKLTYVLTIDGLVDNPLELSYDDLLGFTQISKLMPLNCVEGWGFTAKWTGPSLVDLFAAAKVQSGAKIAIFYTEDVPDGYSSLDLSYINEKNIILGMKLNDITLPDDRGFPFQVVAESKYGYKWSKWITRIELSDNTDFRGYWESAGYNNNADDNGPAFESSR